MNYIKPISALLAATALAGILMLQVHGQDAPNAVQSEQQYKRMLDDQAMILKRSASLLSQQEDFIRKQEEAFKRYEKVLATWEKQQKQYQKYLDSLRTK